MTKITLRPGDYIRTKGMTEEQYHAVVKAFLEAGCPGIVHPLTKDTSRYVGWRQVAGWGETFAHANTTDGLHLYGRELTIDQILGTEPDADGWIEWHGGECPVEKGTLVDARYRSDDASSRELADDLRWIHIDMGGDIIAYRIHQPEQEEAPMTIEQLLTKANKHAAKAQEHREKAAKHERKVDEHEEKRVELVEQARQLMPGYTLEISAEWERDVEEGPTEDMTDPANWKAGDVVECVVGSVFFLEGEKYVLTNWSCGHPINKHHNRLSLIDRDGDDHFAESPKQFRWISRPQ